METITALILAAGMGTRMKSNTCKVLHHVAGRPMLAYVLEAVQRAGIDQITLVIGHQSAHVKEYFANSNFQYVEQRQQLGTGHAVLCAKDVFDRFDGHVCILCGDTPLITDSTLSDFFAYHRNARSQLTVLTTTMDNPESYGRIIRDDHGDVIKIVEQRDASDTEKAVNEINTGTYLVHSKLLFELLNRIGTENDQGEYYLTDIVSEAAKINVRVHGFQLDDAEQMTGVNTRIELAHVSEKIWDQKRRDLMLAGVTLLDPKTVYIDHDAEVGADTIIHPNVTLAGDTRIGRNCVIESGVMISDCVIGNGVEIRLGSRLERSVVRDSATIGPMAHLRPDTEIGPKARIGNFVEVKKSVVGEGTKASHLTYLGDSEIGSNVNIGAGTITCNYDGKRKYRTIIRDKCFVGADVQLKAPIEIGEGSIIGAGSTITKDVPPGTLAVTRSKQRIYRLREDQVLHKEDEDR